MRILTYKRTHVGDPDATGVFGVHDCMGQVRGYEFDAVIGVGGIGAEPRSYGIDGKINWVGIKAKKIPKQGHAPTVMFEHFVLEEQEGPLLRAMAPNLAQRMYEGGSRILLNDYTEAERAEALAIIEWAFKRQSHPLTFPQDSSASPSGGCSCKRPFKKVSRHGC